MSTTLAEPSVDQKEAPVSPFQSLHDLRCPVAALLGTGSITVRQCLELQPDSLVTLRQQAGDDLQVRVADVLVAHGEVLIFEDATSIRITKLAGDGAEG